MTGIVHVWASPDESIDADEMVCTDDEPWSFQEGKVVVYHPGPRIGGAPHYDYVCPRCGTSTNRGAPRTQ